MALLKKITDEEKKDIGDLSNQAKSLNYSYLTSLLEHNILEEKKKVPMGTFSTFKAYVILPVPKDQRGKVLLSARKSRGNIADISQPELYYDLKLKQIHSEQPVLAEEMATFFPKNFYVSRNRIVVDQGEVSNYWLTSPTDVHGNKLYPKDNGNDRRLYRTLLKRFIARLIASLRLFLYTGQLPVDVRLDNLVVIEKDGVLALEFIDKGFVALDKSLWGKNEQPIPHDSRYIQADVFNKLIDDYESYKISDDSAENSIWAWKANIFPVILSGFIVTINNILSLGKCSIKRSRWDDEDKDFVNYCNTAIKEIQDIKDTVWYSEDRSLIKLKNKIFTDIQECIKDPQSDVSAYGQLVSQDRVLLLAPPEYSFTNLTEAGAQKAIENQLIHIKKLIDYQYNLFNSDGDKQTKDNAILILLGYFKQILTFKLKYQKDSHYNKYKPSVNELKQKLSVALVRYIDKKIDNGDQLKDALLKLTNLDEEKILNKEYKNILDSFNQKMNRQSTRIPPEYSLANLKQASAERPVEKTVMEDELTQINKNIDYIYDIVFYKADRFATGVGGIDDKQTRANIVAMVLVGLRQLLRFKLKYQTKQLYKKHKAEANELMEKLFATLIRYINPKLDHKDRLKSSLLNLPNLDTEDALNIEFQRILVSLNRSTRADKKKQMVKKLRKQCKKFITYRPSLFAKVKREAQLDFMGDQSVKKVIPLPAAFA